MDGAPGPARRLAALAVAAGFFVAAAEMVFMSSPFAAYFYGFYSPLLRLVGDTPHLAWLTEFWVSHVYAPNPILGAVPWVGTALAGAGFVSFLVHAIYLYRVKFGRKTIGDRLLYVRVRHPQYAGLIVAGVGLALLWPRFLNLFMLLAMSAAYALLARWEEKRMALAFGDAYCNFAAGKAMFLPGDPGGRLARRLLGWLPAGAPRTIGGFVVTAAAAIGAALLIRAGSLHSLRVVEVPGEPRAIIVAYADAFPEDAASALAPIARGGSEGRGLRMLFVMKKKKTLEHLLGDSGVRRDVRKQLALPEADLYVVRAVVRPAAGDIGRRMAGDASWAYRLSAHRVLDGVFTVALGNEGAPITEIPLPAGASYPHARVPLL